MQLVVSSQQAVLSAIHVVAAAMVTLPWSMHHMLCLHSQLLCFCLHALHPPPAITSCSNGNVDKPISALSPSSRLLP